MNVFDNCAIDSYSIEDSIGTEKKCDATEFCEKVLRHQNDKKQKCHHIHIFDPSSKCFRYFKLLFEL